MVGPTQGHWIPGGVTSRPAGRLSPRPADSHPAYKCGKTTTTTSIFPSDLHTLKDMFTQKLSFSQYPLAPGCAGGRVVRAHAINAADPSSIPAGGPLLHVTSPSPSCVSSLSTANKGVYAIKKNYPLTPMQMEYWVKFHCQWSISGSLRENCVFWLQKGFFLTFPFSLLFFILFFVRFKKQVPIC